MSGAEILSLPAQPYKDGSEGEILRELEAVADPSSGSDELRARIKDWPTRYHFSPARRNLLAPLLIRRGTRVLDVGGGTGPLARYLAEKGADVTLVDSSLERARAAAERCLGLGVRIAVGAIDDFHADEPFDVVLLVGCLEYAEGQPGSTGAFRDFLTGLRRLVDPAGVLVVAIENQLGLKYLVGYTEDHEGLPWIGVEGYPAASRARTLSRHTLGLLLTDAGFENQQWLFPFPDYKVPSVIVDERAYAGVGGADLVDGIVRDPCAGGAPTPLVLCDERATHRSFLEAGLGPDVANSFLVVAGGPGIALESWVRPATIAWLFGRERASTWTRCRRLDQHPDGGLILIDDDAPVVREQRWLRQVCEAETPFVAGRSLDVLVIEALGRREVEVASELLGAWRRRLEDAAEPRIVGSSQAQGVAQPFLVPGSRRVLPPEFLDVDLGNFVQTQVGLRRIDLEWEAVGGVDLVLVAYRALVNLAGEMVRRGSPHPFGAADDAWSLARSLARLAGLPDEDVAFCRLPEASAELSQLVFGTMTEREEVADPRRAIPRLPFSALRRRLLELLEESAAAQHAASSQRDECARRAETERFLRAELIETHRKVAQLDRERQHSDRERQHNMEAAVASAHEVDRLRAEQDALHKSETWRLGSVLVRPVALISRRRRRGV